MMKPVKYTGPDERLADCKALALPSDKAGTIRVQFTDVNARSINELKDARDVSDLEQLMFGWHEMPEDHFEEVNVKMATKKRGKKASQDGGPMHAQFLRGGDDG
ncbi:hypothetical protein [Roseobacter phage RDJL6]|nr:hypothetical protein [Roseobacter phage RDJL6]